MPDGSIIFSTGLDNAQLEKELARVTKKIQGMEEKIQQKQAEKMPLVEQSKQLAANLDAAKARLEYMQNATRTGVEFFTRTETKDKEAAVKTMQSEWDKVQGQVEKYEAGIQKANIELNRQKETAGALEKELAAASGNASIMAPALKKADDYMEQFAHRVKGLARRVLVFSVITMALRSMRTWMGKVIKTNGEATTALAKLKGALLTLAQPLVSVIIPAFTTFVNVLARLITSIAKVFSMLFGGTIEQSQKAAKGLNEETNALEGVGGAADKAEKSMASFDEINQLSGSSGGEGGGASSAEIEPDFEFDTTGADGLLKVIQAIGAALLAWKISSALQTGLSGFLGMLLAIYSAAAFVKNLFDAWANGVSWDNLLGMILSAIGLAAGLGIALGPVAAGISLIVTGLAMLVTGFHDAFEGGWNLQNLLLSIAGIMAAGAGIGILAGSWAPLLISAIASILLAITAAYGSGERLLEGVKTTLQGFMDFLTGVFTGDLTLAIQGIGEIFAGLNEIGQAVLDALSNLFNSFLDWLDEKTQGKLSGLIEWIRGFLTSHVETLKAFLSSVIQSVEMIFTGLVNFISGVFTGEWDRAWQGVKEVFKGIWNTIVSILECGINFLINGINLFIDGINRAFSAIRSLTGYPPKIKSIAPVELPRLAAGAVIPPNREFMAVLGDQKSGNNIEAPESLIRRIVREEAGNSGGSGDTTIIMEVDGQQFAKLVYRANKNESRRVGTRLVEV